MHRNECQQRAEVILLAAGKSSRAGQPKGLIPHRGKPWLRHQLERLPVPAIIVLGFHRESYRHVVEGCDAVLVVNPDPGRGQFSSLQEGLRRSTADVVFVLPLDTPSPGKEVWIACKKALTAPVKVAVPEFHGRGGHPVAMTRDFAQHLLTYPDSARLDDIIRELAPAQVARVRALDSRLVMNLNTTADFREIEQA